MQNARLARKLFHACRVHRGNHHNAAVEPLLERRDVCGRTDFVADHHVRRERAHGAFDPLGLGIAVEHVGADAQVVLRHARIHRAKLAALVHN